jgi:glucokinase
MADPSAAPVIGIDLGGTNMQFGVVDASNAIVGRARAKTDAAMGLEHVIDNVVAGAQAACREAERELSEIAAVGIAAAGAIDVSRGVILIAPNLDWRDVPFRDMLEQRLERRVVLDNDVNAAVWAEYLLSGEPRSNDALGVWVGTGVGGGLLLNRRLHHGDFFTAGEIGHTILRPDAPPGQRTVEELCSRTGLRRAIAEVLNRPDAVPLSELCDGDADRLDTAALHAAYQQRDPLAVSLIDDSARLLGIAIANWVTMLAVGTVIIGGGVTEALGEQYIERIRASFDAHVFPDASRACRLVTTRLEADAGLLGAALLARDRPAERFGASA